VNKVLSRKKVKAATFQTAIITIAVILLILAFIPIILMFVLSLKSNVQIYGNFWSLPNPIQWSNYNKAIGMLIPNMINTVIVVTIATILTVFLSANAGYVFAKMEFPGKNILFMAIISLMMVPGVLTLTPQYSLMQSYKIYNTWLALILPWIAGGQVFGIILCRTFMSGLPTEVFESARMDGCSEFRALFKMAIPLAKPILATVAIMKMIDYYNDFIWPLMVIENNSKQVITVAIRVFQSSTGTIDLGSMIAGFVFATIPMLILFIFTSRLYIEGITSGAVKG
jgi:ABC-type glycerol-3-phosphate transport system permease component